jgi:hypothetical protein
MELPCVFPPRTAFDILAYDTEEIVAGYRQYRDGDPEPGDNRSASYRWGWANARKDVTREPDGFEPLRRDFIRMVERPQ